MAFTSPGNSGACTTHRRDRTAGFSLLEAIVASALAGVIALSVVTMMAVSVSTGEAAEKTTELTATAVDQLELLNALSFSSNALRAGGAVDENRTGYFIDPLPTDSRKFLRWQIEDVTFSLKRIRMVAGIRSTSLGARTIELETYRVLTQ